MYDSVLTSRLQGRLRGSVQNAQHTLSRHFSELTQKARKRVDELGGDESEGGSSTHHTSGAQRFKKMFQSLPHH